MPDGSVFDRFVLYAEFQELIRQVVAAVECEESCTARAAMDEAKEMWCRTHDRDIDKWPWDGGLEMLLYFSCHAMRGHLTGPERMGVPYNFRVSEEERDWNHYHKGACLYCAHCVILMQHMSMDRYAYPIRFVDPPVYAEPYARPRN